MIDVTRLREIVQAMARGDMSQIDPALTRADVGYMMLTALDELEATRRPVADRFDTAAAREELARIDAMWAHLDPVTEEDAFHAARALLDRALAAIDAGWPEPAGEIARLTAALADERKDVSQALDMAVRWERRARAAEDAREPVTITPDVVEKAAKRAWDIPMPNGDADHIGYWHEQDDAERANRRNEARAVLEYAASIGLTSAPATVVDLAKQLDAERRAAYMHVPGVTPATPSTPPAKSPADRLTDYRCAFIIRGMSCESAEQAAHAMLAAEKEPTNATSPIRPGKAPMRTIRERIQEWIDAGNESTAGYIAQQIGAHEPTVLALLNDMRHAGIVECLSPNGRWRKIFTDNEEPTHAR